METDEKTIESTNECGAVSMSPSTSLLCRLMGHHPTGEITGFRNIDAAAISRCKRCGVPIVCAQWRASRYVMRYLHNAESEVSE